MAIAKPEARPRGRRYLIAFVLAGLALFSLTAVLAMVVAGLADESRPIAIYLSEGDPDTPPLIQKNERYLPDTNALALDIALARDQQDLEERFKSHMGAVIVTGATFDLINRDWVRQRLESGVMVIGLGVDVERLADRVAQPDPPGDEPSRFFSALTLVQGVPSASIHPFIDIERFGEWLRANIPRR